MAHEVLDIRRIDLHIHTNFSDGKFSVEEVLRVARVKGLKAVAITDHYSEFQVFPRRMSKRHLRGYLEALEGVNAFKGLEVEVLDDGTVSMSPDIKEDFDIIIGGLHILHGRRFWGDLTPILDSKGFVEDVRVAFIKAMESRLLDVVAHITWLPESIRPRMYDLIDVDWIRSVVEAASDFGGAIELSGRWRVPNEDFVEECVRQGVKLSLGSDSHRLHEVGGIGYGVRILEKLKVPRELIYLPGNPIP